VRPQFLLNICTGLCHFGGVGVFPILILQFRISNLFLSRNYLQFWHRPVRQNIWFKADQGIACFSWLFWGRTKKESFQNDKYGGSEGTCGHFNEILQQFGAFHLMSGGHSGGKNWVDAKSEIFVRKRRSET
jgi:hypothetical protein